MTLLAVHSIYEEQQPPKALLPIKSVESLSGGTTRRLLLTGLSNGRPGRSSTRTSGPR